MALSYVEQTIRGITQDVIVVDGNNVIQKNALTSWDIAHLTKAEAGAGGDMKAKMEGYTMPNGKTAYAYYANYIFDSAAVIASWYTTDVKAIAADVKTLTDDVADHETRITTLEAV